jgi:uncharacterized membrane protein
LNPLDAALDSAGRGLLLRFSWSTLGVVTVVITLAFFFWRRLKYREWPSKDDCVGVALSLLAIFNAVIVGIVFLMTNPPAIDQLSRVSVITVGLMTPIITIGYALPRLWAQFFPPKPPEPPPQDPNSK